jgi:hypothetical protein
MTSLGSIVGIVGSNPTIRKDVCLYSLCFPVHAAALRRLITCPKVPRLKPIGSGSLMTFGNETYNQNLTNYGYKYGNCTRNLVGSSFGRCLRNRLLLSGCVMRFTVRSGSALR